MSTGLALFDTAIGVCGVAWSDRGITAVALPEGDESRTRARLLRRHPDAAETAPPPNIADTITKTVALLAGDPRDLAGATLDMTGVPTFHQRVYQVTLTIPPGATLTYGEIAARLGVAGAARAVGQALGRNPFPIIVPCHRVVAAGRKLGGFSARGGAEFQGAAAQHRGPPRASLAPPV
jgi:methylated-DNA-[protein]-cysteine S-methyltransferase